MHNLNPANNQSIAMLPNEITQIAKYVTQQAALACNPWIGKGDEKAADKAAVDAMRRSFDHFDISAEIVIGEGERDQAPMLYIGEKVGKGGIEIDVAVDPLEGTTICASALPNSIAVLAMAERGGLLNAPDIYMEKIAIGIGANHEIIDLELTPYENLSNLAKFKRCSISDLNVCILKRDRHAELIAKVREAGARVALISDGDVAGAIATTQRKTGIDMYYGVGGAPEGVLAAAALSCVGGQMKCKFWYQNDNERKRTKDMGIIDLDFQYTINDMVRSDVVFAATGVTKGWLLDGVKVTKKYNQFSTLIMHKSQKLVSISTDKYIK